MNRRPDRRIALILVVTLVLVGLSWWRWSGLTSETRAADRARAVARNEISELTRSLAELNRRAGSTEDANADTRREAAQATARARGLLEQIQLVERDRNGAALAAFLSGGRVNELRICLAGLNRALNQQSVGDLGVIRTFESVQAACRAAGA